MPGSRNWVGALLLRTPASLRSIRNVPILGEFVHRISHRVLPGDERVWAQIEAGPAKGLWLELNPRTGQNYLRGDAESSVQEVLARKLRPGMVFYDLGANIGLFTLLGARLVGPSGKVFSFEPDAEVANRLRRNVERNGFSNVTVVEAGVWSSSREMMFVVADSASPDHGTGTFMEGTAAGARGSTVRCVALDDFVRDAPPPDAIKCDVEGAEVEALRGAEKLLEGCRPWILCEMHSEENARAWRELLSGLGYNFEAVDTLHILATASREP
jgi:FkbM family methyltransferase